MNLITKVPGGMLKGVVKQLWVMEVSIEDIPYKQVYFPYGSFELIWYIKNPGVMELFNSTAKEPQPDLCYSGQLTQPFTMTFYKPTICVGASFQPWAGNLLYPIPSYDFTDQLITLDQLGDRHRFETDCKTLEEWFRIMQSYIEEKIDYGRLDSMCQYLVSEMSSNPTRHHLNSCLQRIGLSRRRIEQRFLACSGLNMSSFLRKVRFQKAVQMLHSEFQKKSLTNIGLSAGYYDQAHFISEFRHFAAATPSDFARSQGRMKDILIELTGTV
jgi:AraC-like DNA-binding protein